MKYGSVPVLPLRVAPGRVHTPETFLRVLEQRYGHRAPALVDRFRSILKDIPAGVEVVTAHGERAGTPGSSFYRPEKIVERGDIRKVTPARIQVGSPYPEVLAHELGHHQDAVSAGGGILGRQLESNLPEEAEATRRALLHSAVAGDRTRAARLLENYAAYARRSPEVPDVRAHLRNTFGAEMATAHEELSPLAGSFRTWSQKHAGLPLGVGNVLSNIGSSVTRGATRAASALATAAPQTATRFAPQISKGLGLMTKHPQVVGGATLGAGALTIGGAALSQRR